MTLSSSRNFQPAKKIQSLTLKIGPQKNQKNKFNYLNNPNNVKSHLYLIYLTVFLGLDINDTLNLTSFNPADFQGGGDSNSNSFSGVNGVDVIGSIDIDIEEKNDSNLLDEIQKKEDIDESDIQFIKDIKLTGIESERKNLFSSRNVYVLHTDPFNWTVKRRLSDFKWLCERLTREFPDLGVRLYPSITLN